MGQAFSKKIDDMLVIQGVKNHFAFFAVFDQAQITQNPQLMGDRRLLHFQNLSQIADTELLLGEGMKYLDPGGVPQGFEYIRQI